MTLKIITLHEAKTIVGRGKTFSSADLTKTACGFRKFWTLISGNSDHFVLGI